MVFHASHGGAHWEVNKGRGLWASITYNLICVNFPFPLNLTGTWNAAPPSTRAACSKMRGHHLTRCQALSHSLRRSQPLARINAIRPDRRSASFSKGFLVSRSCVMMHQSPSVASAPIHSTSGVSPENFSRMCWTSTPRGSQRASTAFERCGERLLSNRNFKHPIRAQTRRLHERLLGEPQTISLRVLLSLQLRKP